VAAVYRDAGAAALGINGHPQEPATALYLRRPDVTPANPTRSVLGRP
jgi:hypothetical protein